MKKLLPFLLLLPLALLQGDLAKTQGVAISGLAKLQGTAPGGGALQLDYRDQGSDGTPATIFTFSSKSIGAADAREYVIVGIGGRSSALALDITSVTVGGNSATLFTGGESLQDDSPSSTYVGFYYATVAAGTTADVVVTWDQEALRCAVMVYSVDNIASTTPAASDTEALPSNSTNYSMSVTPPSGDSVLLAMGLHRDGGTTVTGDVSEDVDIDMGGTEYMTLCGASGSASDTSSKSVTFDPVSTSNSVRLGVFLCLQ